MAVKYLSDRNPDGACLGYDTTDKIGFFGATPVDQPASTADIKDSLVELGLIADSGATSLNLDSGTLTAATVATTDLTVANDITIASEGNVILSTSTGTQIGTATSQKIGFYSTTPIVQRSGAAQAAVTTTPAVSTTSNIWGFSTSTQANDVVALANEIRAALVALGLIKGSA